MYEVRAIAANKENVPMRITVGQLRRIIKEEVSRSLHEATEYKPSDPAWKELKSYLGMNQFKNLWSKHDSRVMNFLRYAGPYGDRQLVKKALEVYNNELRPSYMDLIAAFEKGGEDDPDFLDALSAHEAIVSKFEDADKNFMKSYKDPGPVNSPTYGTTGYTPKPRDPADQYNREMGGTTGSVPYEPVGYW